ncbi:MAG: transcriptional regulator [Verrucomicrobiaceae bacterium TMED137]|jgi:ArsR family transcriptional regulator|nr:MAG: transcriptional regulator [Verrucomicrobiaceae bacterium TMED137]HAE17671.1 transcriptional regulator [Verrucomicrobiales bacterium]HAN84518.1 transcriptional regulator [Verrucomicrobiales bacterium]HBF17264.1 transcriptional regulator [Verrucomicrobiales bacterium]HBI31834.1 transcriptional regulator [Verrucomicrobiales bacterium]
MPSILNSLKMISDPTRLRILLLLGDESLSVAELQQILGMGQSRISTQLSQLKKEGLVADQRSGKNNIYSAQIPLALGKIISEAGSELPEREKDRSSLRHILRKRKDQVRAYFDELAGKFGREYVPGRSWKGLAEAMLKILNYDTVADLGAGEGTLSQLIAQRAKKVIAVDNSEKMVKFGQNLAKENGLPNLEYRLGDIESPPIDDSSVDLAILSQALHHAEHPSKALSEAHRILKPGGRLIVLDLLQHTFEKARELYFDTWLGFPEAELAEMITSAGFSEVETAIVDREEIPPNFQTLLASAAK